MFSFRKKKLDSLEARVRSYISAHYHEPAVPAGPDRDIRYSRRQPSGGSGLNDRYDAGSIRATLSGLPYTASPGQIRRMLDDSTDMSFVDKMLEHISRKNASDASVYKAAQVDRRLFSKMVIDRSYKPAKDTCIAICLALRLTLPETADLLSRAGYTLSHSSKRDVVVEYCINEQIYDLITVNDILFRLEEKPIGR